METTGVMYTGFYIIGLCYNSINLMLCDFVAREEQVNLGYFVDIVNRISPLKESEIMKVLEVSDLSAVCVGETVIKNLSLQVSAGSLERVITTVVGDVSPLTMLLAGHDQYKASNGSIQFVNDCLLSMDPVERARRGMFISCEPPFFIRKSWALKFLRTSYNNLKQANLGVFAFQTLLQQRCELLGLNPKKWEESKGEFLSVFERKQLDALLAVLVQPRIAILDLYFEGLNSQQKVWADGVLKALNEMGVAILITERQIQ